MRKMQRVIPVQEAIKEDASSRSESPCVFSGNWSARRIRQ